MFILRIMQFLVEKLIVNGSEDIRWDSMILLGLKV